MASISKIAHILATIIGVIGVQTMISCSSDIDNPPPPSSGFLYSCQLPTASCIRVATALDCSAAGGVVVDACPASSSSSSSRPGSSSSARSSSSSAGLGACSGSTVTIGSQVWQKCNSNAVPSTGNSWCYNNQESNCAIYGRLYDWSAAMALPSACNGTSCSSQIQSKHRGICPSGFHVPGNADWDKLFRYADGTSGTGSPYDSPAAGRYLKSASGWNSNGNGEDTYGFAALPGGIGNSDGNFVNAGNYGSWWSASEYDANYAYYRYMYYNYEGAYWDDYSKSTLFSVRCLQD